MSNETIDQDVLDLLAPGHVWKHTKNGRESTVLAITNTYIPEHLQVDGLQPTVVYLDFKGRPTSMYLTDFVAKRGFSHVEPGYEHRAIELLSFNPADEEEHDGEINIDLEEQAINNAVAEITEAEDRRVTASFSEPEEVIHEIRFLSRSGTPEIDSDRLAAAFEQYEQDPMVAQGQIRHKVLFSLEDLTMAEIRDAFNSGGPIYDMFFIGKVVVDWQEFHGVYPVLDPSASWASAVFVSPLEVRTTSDEIVTQNPVDAGQPVLNEEDTNIVISTEAPAAEVAPAPVPANPVVAAKKAPAKVASKPVSKVAVKKAPVKVAAKAVVPATPAEPSAPVSTGEPAFEPTGEAAVQPQETPSA